MARLNGSVDFLELECRIGSDVSRPQPTSAASKPSSAQKRGQCSAFNSLCVCNIYCTPTHTCTCRYRHKCYANMSFHMSSISACVQWIDWCCAVVAGRPPTPAERAQRAVVGPAVLGRRARLCAAQQRQGAPAARQLPADARRPPADRQSGLHAQGTCRRCPVCCAEEHKNMFLRPWNLKK